ncbi:hypothetical protein ACVIHI_006479 [Bradyrhizobium sp. USDA 4524]|nr:hypothetical protein [Bradyrhizobium sp. USDA 4538]MCP1901166.1 hypothetical protein [Bradyrhizobium sp. USDA 4537]MCP1993178.1 hypothetical protein [Bradyrhizobium sp. USDA 4539]
MSSGRAATRKVNWLTFKLEPEPQTPVAAQLGCIGLGWGF